MERPWPRVWIIDVGGLPPPPTPRRSKMGLLDAHVLARCLFPWSAPSAETRQKRLRGLRSETGLGASTGRADGVALARARSSRRNH